MEKSVIKWTWFHRNFYGKNVVVQNRVIDICFFPSRLARWFEMTVKDIVETRKFTLHRMDGESATFITPNGDFVNVRIA